jgi:cellobiose phosphorylase
MYRVLLHDILGIKREGASLRIDPCVARTWRSFEVTFRDGEGVVHVVVDNTQGVQRGVASIEVDGVRVPDGVVPLTGGPGVREVRVVMGQSQPP